MPYKSEHDLYDHHFNKPPMKESEKLKESLNGDDWEGFAQAMKEQNKELRQERLDRFDENWLRKLESIDGLMLDYNEKMGRYAIEYEGKKYDFYPKVNKVLIRSKNTWVKPGLRYLIKLFDLKP
jgi:hypothetical protein